MSCEDSQEDFPGRSVVRESACQCRGLGFNPQSGKIAHDEGQSGKIAHDEGQLSPCATTTEPVL